MAFTGVVVGSQAFDSFGAEARSALALGPESSGGFSSVSIQRSGIEFRNNINIEALLRSDYRPALNGSLGGGVAVGDLNGDGLVDLYLVGRETPDALYFQVAPFEFKRVDSEAGLSAPDDGVDIGVSFLDVESDGDLDIFVTRYAAPNRLWINDGEGRFSEEARERGLAFSGSSVSAAAQDYDLDGDLDIYLVTNRLFPTQERLREIVRLERERLSAAGSMQDIPESYRELLYYFEYDDAETGERISQALKAGQKDILYRNRGDGSFEEVTEAAGLTRYYRGHSATWWDYDRDRDPDLYVSNDYFDPDLLFKNRGDGTFEEIAGEALPMTPWFSMGSDAFDVDNDGRFDLLAADMAATTHYKSKLNMGMMDDTAWFLKASYPRQNMRNALYLNTGGRRFQEIAFYSGLNSTDWTWSVLGDDFDSDGLIDVFFTNGFIRNIMDSDLKLRSQGDIRDIAAFGEALIGEPVLRERDLLFKNLGSYRFENVSAEWDVGFDGVSMGAVSVDLDRDGDLDLVVNRVNAPVGVYENLLATGNYLTVRLEPAKSAPHGVGAVVEATADGRRWVRRLNPTRGYASSGALELHFGLGEVELLETLTIEWPSGVTQRLRDVAVNQRLVVGEEATEGEGSDVNVRNRKAPMFSVQTKIGGVDFEHQSSVFDDFSRQPLVPYRATQLGSGLAVGDYNGDVRDDIYFAGGAGQVGELYAGGADGFRRVDGPWGEVAQSHETSPLWIDVDGDGDTDLFVASGGAHRRAHDLVYRDRLYLNNGDETFSDASSRLPELTTSVGPASAADFDRDGDIDLFLGGRVTPWRYPVTPRSHLLENRDGEFVEVTESLAPGLVRAGMVTSALWTDINGDGWLDLMLALEWGPVRVFANTGRGFREVTNALGLGQTQGWRASLAAGDIDRDGDMDYFVGSTGDNTKYHATPEHPTLLYFGDYANSGDFRIVEAKYEGNRLLPVRGRSCSTAAMPFLSERFRTFDQFARSSLGEIYTIDALSRATELRANGLESILLINELPDGGFRVVHAPPIAQFAPVFGVAFADFDLDGWPDLVGAQNFFGPEPETGPMSGGIGFALMGGDGVDLTAAPPTNSGVFIPGDAKGLAVLDVNGDSSRDIVITQNNQRPLALVNQTSTEDQLIVRLVGKPGNPNAVGARARIVTDSGVSATQELYAGNGYWSQSSSTMTFFRETKRAGRLEIRWPDGKFEAAPFDGASQRIIVNQSDPRVSPSQP